MNIQSHIDLEVLIVDSAKLSEEDGVLAVETVVSQLEDLGIQIVDSFVTDGEQSWGDRLRGQVVGFLPGKALLVQVIFTLWAGQPHFSLMFSIEWTPQAREYYWPPSTRHDRLTNLGGAVSCAEKGFKQITIVRRAELRALDGQEAGIPEAASEAIDGLAIFLQHHIDEVAPRFSESIFLWFVIEYTKEWEAAVEKNRLQDFYRASNDRVLRKFPPGLLHESQTP